MINEDGKWAPVALFIYHRADHVRRTIESLRACIGFDQSEFYVYADGPKNGKDEAAVRHTRAVTHDLLGERVTFVERQQNIGLSNSIIHGVTELCERFGKVIVVEDDLVVSPYFLKFLNDGLDNYTNEPRVMHISAHMYDVPSFRTVDEAIFLPTITSWGWATWKRAWELFDPKAVGWRELLRDKDRRARFDLNGNADKSKMLELQMMGNADSWAIRWYYSVFICGGLGLFPPRTLVVNVGLDGSGTHHRLGLPVRQARIEIDPEIRFPSEVVVSSNIDRVYAAVRSFAPTTPLEKATALSKSLLYRLVSPFFPRPAD